MKELEPALEFKKNTMNQYKLCHIYLFLLSCCDTNILMYKTTLFLLDETVQALLDQNVEQKKGEMCRDNPRS